MANTIIKKWNGNDFDELYPRTTTGQIVASGTPSSSTFLRGDGSWATPVGGGTVGYPGLLIKPANGLFIANGIGNTLTTGSFAQSSLTLTPFMTNYNVSIDQIGVSSTANATDVWVKLIVYNSDTNGRPSTVLAVSSEINFGTLGTLFATINASLTAGTLYFLGVWVGYGSITLRTHQSYNAMCQTWSDVASPVGTSMLRITQTYAGGSPGTWTYASTNHTAGTIPLVLMRVSG